MNLHHKISYVEFAAHDLIATKAFFESAFGWTFADYGPEYSSFSDQGIDGGFYVANLTSNSDHGGALVILFSDALEATLEKVAASGGKIVKPIFSFPGGRRFHFTEPSGNELAVWGA